MVEIKRTPTETGIKFTAVEGGKITAEIYGETEEKIFRIKQYTGDKYLFDGMVRAVINHAEHCGAAGAVIENTVEDLPLVLFGYKREIPSISEFFEVEQCQGCKNCGSKE